MNCHLELQELQNRSTVAGMAIQLDDMALFTRIVELGTLSAAARERNVPVSQVTRALARLEAACGARLLHRSTHGLSLTDEGDAVLAHGRRLLDTAAELKGELSGKVSGPSGWVRLSVSPVLAQAVIAPSLPTLYRKHPQLHVDIAADDRMVDMAREGIDIALRTGTTHTDTVVARQIGQLKRALYASPAYVAEFGLPDHPGDLEAHRLIANSGSPVLNRWTTAPGKGEHALLVKGHTRTDNTAVMLSLVLHGVGIARLAELAARPLVRRGELVPVLPERFEMPDAPLYAVMLQERHRLPKIRACIDHLASWVEGQQRGP
jgi:DNA-binding transcriptional LysR family regulator